MPIVSADGVCHVHLDELAYKHIKKTARSDPTPAGNPDP
jgi:hypothetical protein